MRVFCVILIALVAVHAPCSAGAERRVAKAVLNVRDSGTNLLKADAWRPWQEGFERQGKLLVCDNADDAKVQRGAVQTVVLNQTTPEPIVATVESRSEGVGGSADNNYALYLDLVYTDGTPLWGQAAAFGIGTHDWQRRRVVVLPEKPVKQVSFYVLLRSHAGKAWFREPMLQVVDTPAGACTFDGVPVIVRAPVHEGFQVRDVAAGSDFVRIDDEAAGLKLDWKTSARDGVTTFDVELRDTTGTDRAVTLLYAVPVAGEGLRWLHDPRSSTPVEPRREYVNAGRFRAGANGRLSRYPLGAVSNAKQGTALGIDMARPAFFRVGYNAGSGELFLAYDIGLTPEKPSARLRLVRYTFEPRWGFRAALARFYEIFPHHFRCRTPEQGLWMPFAKISQVKGWEDFGFKFKEGNNETSWDDEHGIVTFRYTEPMTWWMPLPDGTPRTYEAALTEAQRLADAGDVRAKALLAAGYHDAAGRLAARLRDTPWCNGAVWSMNSMPGVGADFNNKWNARIRDKRYGPRRSGDLDGEYVDSSEGYVTDELNFRRDHFAATDTPLTFSPDDHRPAIFRGLIAFEYVRGLARDVHGMDKLMMANGAPTRLCWLAPMLEVMGTETNWNPAGSWRPMSDAELLYRRAICRGKPYCFLMNTPFEQFSHELVERYMKRCLAYGMFPGFFSHNASQGHYFSRPELYDRDRPLFKRYIPLCRRVAEAGWQPITRASSSDEQVHVERFGDRYLTVLNDSTRQRTVSVTLDAPPQFTRELLTGRPIEWRDGKATLTLDAEDVAVFDLRP
ncbi:MAG: hypothetical protein HQ567_03055 [Candidatus Nealsonbacteria bacterium]|nr:hypothetical protein [Candidatus Nealsonbacteria bacterium]